MLVCLTHERACAADEAEEAALGWKSSTFAADKDRTAVSLSAEISPTSSFLFARKEEVWEGPAPAPHIPTASPGLVTQPLSSRKEKGLEVETAGRSTAAVCAKLPLPLKPKLHQLTAITHSSPYGQEQSHRWLS